MQADVRRRLDAEVDDLFARPADEGLTLALVVVRHGEIVAERYGVRPANLFQPEEAPITRRHAADLVEHRQVDDPRRARRARRRRPHRPRRPGARARVGGHGEGVDHAARPAGDALRAAVRRGLRRRRDVRRDRDAVRVGRRRTTPRSPPDCRSLHPPGTVWSYSSGTTNILCRILGDLVSGRRRTPASGRRRCGRSSTSACSVPPGCPTPTRASTRPARSPARRTSTPRPGSSPASASCTCATGWSADVRVLPAGWVDHARTIVAATPRPASATAGTGGCGRDQPGSLAAHGYEGQYLVVLPEHDAVRRPPRQDRRHRPRPPRRPAPPHHRRPLTPRPRPVLNRSQGHIWP